MKNLRSAVQLATLWNATGIILNKGAASIFTIILAGLLTPSEFGLIAMIIIVLELALVLTQSGLTSALIRDKQATDTDYNSVLWLSLLLATLGYAIIFSVAPYVAQFYNEDRLTELLRVVGLSVFISALKVVPTAKYSKALNFKRIAQASVVGAIISGVIACVLAWLGFGAWSLVAQILIMSLVNAIYLWAMLGWRPKFEFSLQSVKQMWGFGYKILIDGLLAVAFNNMYVIAIGRAFDAATTGVFYLSEKIVKLISHQLSHLFESVSFPALVHLNDDKVRLLAGYRELIRVVTFIIVVALSILILTSSYLVNAFLDVGWQELPTYIAIICIAHMLYPLGVININVYKVLNRAGFIVKLNLCKRLLGLSILIVAISYGISAVLWGMVITGLVNALINGFFLKREINYQYRAQLQDAAVPIIVGLFFVYLIQFLIEAEVSFLLATLSAVMFLGLYVFTLYFLSRNVVNSVMKNLPFRRNSG